MIHFPWLGIEADAVTISELNGRISQAIHERRRYIVANHNLHSLYLFHKNTEMRGLYAIADCTHVDGMPLIFYGRLLGLPFRREHRITYLDWLDPLMRDAQSHGWRLFFLGATEEVAQLAVRTLGERYPGVTLTAHNGYFTRDANSAVLARIDAFDPHILLLGMGMPRQERWTLENLSKLGRRVVLMSGGLMDYVAGATPVPPRWIAGLGFEWLCRLTAEPRRLAFRYTIEPLALAWLLLRNGLRR